MEFETSQAILTFQQNFDETREEIHALNPKNGCVAGEKWDDAPLNDKNIEQQTDDERDRRHRVRQSFLKSAIVNTMVVFESFISDLFAEAFDFTRWRRPPGIREECEHRWSGCKQLVMKLIDNYNKKNRKNEFYNITRDCDIWMYLLNKHVDDTLSDLKPRITVMRAVLNKLFALDKTTTSLLPKKGPAEYDDDEKQKVGSAAKNKDAGLPVVDRADLPKAVATGKVAGQMPKKSNGGKNDCSASNNEDSKQPASKRSTLSEFPLETMIKNGTFDVLWQVPDRNNRQVFWNILVTMEDMDAVTHILDLFYAIRCVTVHGKSQITIDGCLKNFPKSPDELKIGHSAVEDYLFEIYEQILNDELEVDYHLCVNVTRFTKSTAYGLEKALGYFAYYQLKYNEDKMSYHKFWGLKMYVTGMDVPWGKTLRKEKEDQSTLAVNGNEDRED